MAAAATLAQREIAKVYERHRTYVLAVLSRRSRWLARDEREEIFHDAYAVLLQKQREGALDLTEMSAGQVRAYLTQTAINKALDEGKRAGRNRSVPLGDAELTAPDERRPPEELVAASVDSARVREIVAELPERRQAIVKLRFFFDRTPTEIQRFLGISERVYRRELERSLRHLVERYRMVEDGSFCEGRRGTILAYVAGIAGPDRARTARTHLATCPSCARAAAELREVARQAAALLPPPLFVAHERGRGLTAAFDWVRDTALQVSTTAKQHAAAVTTRVDGGSAGYLSAARPGTVAATILGCIAIGGSATYCVVEGVPLPIDRAPQPEKAAPVHRKQPKPAPATTASAAATPEPSPETTTLANTARAQAQQQREAARAKAEARTDARQERKRESRQAAQTEFGFESSGESSAASTTSDSTATTSSATASSSSSSAAASSAPSSSPAPAGGGAPGEFDP